MKMKRLLLVVFSILFLMAFMGTLAMASVQKAQISSNNEITTCISGAFAHASTEVTAEMMTATAKAEAGSIKTPTAPGNVKIELMTASTNPAELGSINITAINATKVDNYNIISPGYITMDKLTATAAQTAVDTSKALAIIVMTNKLTATSSGMKMNAHHRLPISEVSLVNKELFTVAAAKTINNTLVTM